MDTYHLSAASLRISDKHNEKHEIQFQSHSKVKSKYNSGISSFGYSTNGIISRQYF